MKSGFVLLVAAALVALPGTSQTLNVYSEFAQIDAQGRVVAPETPREILSPALVRNGFTTFQVVVQAPPDMSWVLRIGQNPDKAATITLYRGASGHLVRAAEPVTGNSTETFWMDVWVEKTDPVRRIKVEPTVEIKGEWLTYPMEMRVRENVAPDFASNPNAAVEPGSPFEILQAYVCRGKQPPAVPTAIASADAIHLRNAHQDVAMASQLSSVDRDELRKWMGGCTARTSNDPEAYLHVRDYFFTPLWMKVARDK
jgi:hypothetical protein